MSAAFPETHTTTTTSTVTTTSRPYFDVTYIKSLPGILKVLEIVLSFVTFCICASSYDWQGKAGWSSFVSFMGFLLTLILLILFVFHIVDLVPKLPWLLIELVYYVLWAIFFFVAGICMAVLADRWSGTSWKATAGAGAFFCFVCFVLFAVDAFLKFKAFAREVQT